jgi:hypothetical protein
MLPQYKHKLILLCKTFGGDIDRFAVLFDSIQTHNTDNIPFYVILPKNEESLFVNRFGDAIIPVFEDSLWDTPTPQNHFFQQLYKMLFYKTEIAEYFVILDSDMYFIRNFSVLDFIADDGIPYITMHENKMLRELSVNITGDNRINAWFDGERKKIQEVFGRRGKSLDYSGSAILYASEVLRTLYEEYCKPNSITFLDLLNECPSENTWIGEWLLYKEFKFYPCEPMFKTFHYPFQYKLHKSLGHTEAMFSQIYLGITMQSNWNAPLRYE